MFVREKNKIGVKIHDAGLEPTLRRFLSRPLYPVKLITEVTNFVATRI